MDVEKFTRRLGEALRRRRNGLGLSLRDVEVKSGGEFTGTCVGSWERGCRNIRLERLEALAALYGTRAADLIPGTRTGAPQGALMQSWGPAVEAITEAGGRPAREIAAGLGIEPYRAEAVDAYVTRRRRELDAAARS